MGISPAFLSRSETRGLRERAHVIALNTDRGRSGALC